MGLAVTDSRFVDRPSSPPIASVLGDWVAELEFADLPAEVVEESKRSILEAVGNMVFGASRPRMAAYLHGVARPASGERTPLGPLPVATQAFVSAAYVQSSELDDIFFNAGGHPGSVIVPAVLALAGRTRLSGRQALVATVAGYEVMARATMPIYPQCHLRGFQATGFGGPFGSAAAAAKIAGLSGEATGQSLGIVGSYCCGLAEYDQSGGEVKRLYAALASRAGIEAVDLAAAGLTGPLTIFEGVHGLFEGFAGHSSPELALRDLGEVFHVLRRWSKRYPAVGSTHGALDAVALLFPSPTGHDTIRRIHIEVPEIAVEHGGGVLVPTDMVGAQFSFAYSAALRILFGHNDISLYEDAALRTDPDVVALCHKVVVSEIPDASMVASGGALVTVELTDGSTRRHLQYAPIGTPACPAESSDLEQRFERLTESLPAARRRELVECIMALDEFDDLDPVRRLTDIY